MKMKDQQVSPALVHLPCENMLLFVATLEDHQQPLAELFDVHSAAALLKPALFSAVRPVRM